MAHPRTSASALRRLLDPCIAPVYALDPQRCVAYMNPACLQWLGDGGEQLLGVQCNYHAAAAKSGVAGLAAGLCPPPEAVEGEVLRGWVESRGGRRQAWFLPLPATPSDPASSTRAHAVLAMVDTDVASQQRPADAGALQTSPRLSTMQAWSELSEVYALDNLAGRSAAMERARRQVRLATRDATCSVLVVGPEGTGREHIARTIHVRRAPHGAPILPLACPLLDAELLETSLHAADSPMDLQDPAPPPTLLLLDVDELSQDAQKVLADHLRQHPKLALLSTAKQDLPNLAPQLAAALSTLVIRLPDLQQRVEDLPLLAQMILEQWNATGGRQFSGLTDGALDLLAVFPWRRGVDELREVLHQACRSATGAPDPGGGPASRRQNGGSEP